MTKQLSVFAALALVTGLASANEGFRPVAGPAAQAPAGLQQKASQQAPTGGKVQAPDQRSASVYVG